MLKSGIHIVRRSTIKANHKILLYISSVATALLLGALMLAIIGVNPGKIYFDIFTLSTIGNAFPHKCIEGYIREFVPLVIVSLALSVAFKMKYWNIGGEGQFTFGCIAASLVALTVGKSANPFFTLVLMCLSAFVAGGLYGVLVGIFKITFGTSETLLTLMFNYIALYFVKFLGETQSSKNLFLSEKSVRPVFKTFPKSALMPSIQIDKFGLNISLIFAIFIIVFITYYMKKSKHGYEIKVVGDSPMTARYGGMNVKWIILRTAFASAALIGLAGGFYISSAGVLSTSCTNNVGWTGIIVAWLGNLEMLPIVIVSALISVLQYGSQAAFATHPEIDANYADLLQGVILFLCLIANFFINYKIIKTSKEAK